MTRNAKLATLAAAALAIGCLGYFYWSCKCRPLLERRNALLERKAMLEASNAVMKAKTEDLKDRQHRFQTDPEYVKMVAHENNQLEAGEVLYHFPDESGKQK